jgi:serine/threonine protein kinase
METRGPHDKSGNGSRQISTERYQKIRSLFESAVDLPPDRQLTWLQEACGEDIELYNEVAGLLREDRSADEESLSQFLPINKEQLETIFQEGTRIGAYQVIREIGRGGMSIVYLARRADDRFSKQVAIKVLRPERRSPELDQRFRRECNIVAKLEHPNIARLLDAGATPEGISYAVIEYVEGEPIDAYCNSRRLNITERLKLFWTVCAAVQYAHQNLVIHRDLKPSNILVSGDGIVKLLDFGIAKLINGETGNVQTTFSIGIQVMTPAYASPEQTTRHPVNTSTDVYSLGVILYELVTGRSPYPTKGKPLLEIIQAICRQEPLRPSEIVLRHDESDQAVPEQLSEIREGKPAKLSRRLKGDLDNIVLKALRKEPKRRYHTVEQLGEDLTRHLSGMPVLAQKDTMRYLSAKFVKRHRFGISSAIAFVLLMSMAVIGIIGRRIAQQEREISEQQRKIAEQQSEIERKRAENENLRADQKSREAEQANREAERYRKIADTETANAKQQSQFAQESNAKAEEKDREARQAKERADKFAAFGYAVRAFDNSDLVKAEKSFTLALKGDRNPQWEVWCYIYLGKISDLKGQRKEAINYYTKAVNTKEDYDGALAEAHKWLVAPFSNTEHKAEINNPNKHEETLEQKPKGIAAPLAEALKSANPESASVIGHMQDLTPTVAQALLQPSSEKEARTVSADQQANFSGTWHLDTMLSDAAPKYYAGTTSSSMGAYPLGYVSGERISTIFAVNGVASKIMVIQQTESEILITYNNDSKLVEIMNLVENNKVRLFRQKLTIEDKTISDSMKREFSLSRDGKTMTLKIFTFGASNSIQKLVYQKEVQQANFSGTWRLDTKLSDAEPNCTREGLGEGRGTAMPGALLFRPCDDMGIVSKTLVIHQTESEIRITNSLVEIYKLDKKDETYRASLSKRKFTVETSAFGLAPRTRIRKEFSLSKDGKTMMLKLYANNPRNQSGTGFETWQKLVYHKEAQTTDFSGTGRLDTKLSDSAPKYSRSVAAYGAWEPRAVWAPDTTSVGMIGNEVWRSWRLFSYPPLLLEFAR